MWTRTFFSVVSCLVLALVSAGQLRAVSPDAPITGSASFFGTSSASGPSGAGLTTVFFNPGWVFLNGTGTYAGIPQTAATFAPSFSFTGDGNGVVLQNAVNNLWSFTSAGNTYSFDLLSLTNGHVVSNALSFSGTGILHATGFDATMGTFSMNGSGQNFSFDLSFVTNTAVPEPSSVALAGFGLALCGGMNWLRRRRGSIR